MKKGLQEEVIETYLDSIKYLLFWSEFTKRKISVPLSEGNDTNLYL